MLVWDGAKPDLIADIRALPFQDNYAAEVHAYHVLEHFYRWEVGDVLAEWYRVLKPGGVLVIELPCLDNIIRLISKPGAFVSCRLGLYGEQKKQLPEMVHKWCYLKDEMAQLLAIAGFSRLAMAPPRFHRPERDMRFEAAK